MIKFYYYILMLITVLPFSLKVFSQEGNILIFDEKTGSFVERTSKLSYGEKILIKSESDCDILSVDVSAIFGENEQKAKVEIGGQGWTAIVGPFPINANVIFSIKETKKLPENVIQGVLFEFEKVIRSTTDSIVKGSKSFESESELADFMIPYIQSGMKYIWSKYYTDNGLSLESIFLTKFKAFFESGGGLAMINNLKSRDKIYESDFYNLLKENKEKSIIKNFPNILNLDSICFIPDSTFTRIIDTFSKGDIEEKENFLLFYNSLKNNCINYIVGSNSLKGILQQVKNEGTIILKEETFVTSIITSQEVLGIQSYVGFDVGMIYINDLSATPFFITISPYLTKIEPDEDYRIKWDSCEFDLKSKRNLINSLKYLISPTFGFAIKGGPEKVSPLIFVGLGVRLNKIIRISFGGTYYQPEGINNYKWSTGVSASISVNYISDFLKFINSAQSNFLK